MTEDQEAELDEQADDVDEESEEETAEGLQNGDFVEIAYTARTVEEGQLVDTTDPEVAEEEGVDDQDQEFEPRTIVLGEGHIFEGVEEAITGGEAGDEGSVTISAEEAFGEYDPDDVQTVSADKIDEDDRYPGAHVHIDGEHGYISTIIGGRARVDFNHPLAGEDVEYEYEILEEVDDREQQAQGLIEMYLDEKLELWIETDEVEEEVPVEPDEDEDEDAEPEFETETVEKETLYIEATPQLSMNQQWMFSKQQIAQDVIDKIGVDRVIVQETIDGMGGMGMPGMMGGGMGGMGGGDIEDALEDADVDADEIVDELEGAVDEE
ncbi:FKBP-type peptidyl-prolyl cis-trans isomerase [Halostagnicola kamekurae]|uniref:peptidylprolyl isomerase n=1 Tax=Halostagnicola kamekurae TaxID=619731 RepID=A0A1I6QUJ8_9EURY|nr:peptidylprolyl isomerase [Halostagnicola kamekurae]SFS56089.1 FKBP-type peptidyl-prolyl cis-trans isomerase SlyD [Halostagnicola kamekurae]